MRSISQIYSEAVYTRNNYLQITELNSGRSNSKLSILNLLTYVVAVCIHSYEAILDLFQIRLVEVMNSRINGTPPWYAHIVKQFQFNKALGVADELVFNEETLKLQYEKVDASRRIVDQSSWEVDYNDESLTLKVCKNNPDANGAKKGISYIPLTETELTALKQYIQQVKFVGTVVYCTSLPADRIIIKADSSAPIFYDDRYTTANQTLIKLQNALIDYIGNFKFDDYLYYHGIIDKISQTENVRDLSLDIKVYVSSYNDTIGQYDAPKELVGRYKPKSGYFTLLDGNGVLTVNTNNFTLLPASQMDSFYSH